MHFYTICLSVIYVLSTALTDGAFFEVPDGVQAGTFPLRPGHYIFFFPSDIKSVRWRATLADDAFIHTVYSELETYDPIPPAEKPRGQEFQTLSPSKMPTSFIIEINDSLRGVFRQPPETWCSNAVDVNQETLIQMDPTIERRLIAVLEARTGGGFRVIWPRPSNSE